MIDVPPDPWQDVPTFSNGPLLWTAILASVPGAVVAGGAVRDYLMGVILKDIDIFVSTSSPVDFSFWDPHPKAVEYEAGDHVDAVVQRKFGNWTVDLICVSVADSAEDPRPFGQKVIETFDFGVTRSYFDGQLHDTIEAAHDRRKGQVTLMLDDRLARAWDRFDRFNTSHGGGWTFRAPPRPLEEETIF